MQPQKLRSKQGDVKQCPETEGLEERQSHGLSAWCSHLTLYVQCWCLLRERFGNREEELPSGIGKRRQEAWELHSSVFLLIVMISKPFILFIISVIS